jgi:hypothetical protein
MASDATIKKRGEFLDNVTVGELVKAVLFNIAYLFTMTVIGAFFVTLYGYYIPIDVASTTSVLSVAFIFTFFVIIDFGLLISDKPTPTLIAILLVIAPLFIIYRLLKSADFIQVDRGTPARIKRYVPLRFISE